MRTRAALVSILAALAAAVAAQVPAPVVERSVTRRDVTIRVTLFSNRAVVVTVRRGGEQDFMRRLTLPDDQYMIYLSMLQANAEKLGEEPASSEVETSDGEVVVSLHVGPEAPRQITFSPMSSLRLPIARIMGVLDDLQLQVLEASPSAEAMRSWEPRKGDRVELLNGQYATVVEVWDDGLLFLEHDDTYIREAVPPESRPLVILRVVEPDP
jgi:hypothetical protein